MEVKDQRDAALAGEALQCRIRVEVQVSRSSLLAKLLKASVHCPLMYLN